MDIEYTQDDIDAFVKGTLSPEEHNIFLQKLKEDETLANAVAETQFHFDVANRLIERDLRKMLNEWEEKKTLPPSSPPPLGSPNTRFWQIAAAALVLAVAYFIFRKVEVPPLPPPAEPVAVQDTAGTSRPPVIVEKTKTDLKPAPEDRRTTLSNEVLNTVRSTEGWPKSISGTRGNEVNRNNLTATDTLTKANIEIAGMRYAKARQLLQAVPTNNEDYWTAQMYLGDVYFFEKKFAQAEGTYRATYQQGDIYAARTFWRLAAAHCAARNCDALEAHLKTQPPDTKKDVERANSLRQACQ